MVNGAALPLTSASVHIVLRPLCHCVAAQVSHGAIQFMVYEELRSLAQHIGGSAAEQEAQQKSLQEWRSRQRHAAGSRSGSGGGEADEAEGPWGWRRRRRWADAVSRYNYACSLLSLCDDRHSYQQLNPLGVAAATAAHNSGEPNGSGGGDADEAGRGHGGGGRWSRPAAVTSSTGFHRQAPDNTFQTMTQTCSGVHSAV